MLTPKLYAMIAVMVIALGATWGAREKTWSRRIEEATKRIDTLTAETKTLSTAKTELETQMKSQQDETEEVVPMQFPDGTVAYTTRKSKRTVQEAIARAKSETQIEVAELKRQIIELSTAKKVDEHETIKSAPRWNVIAGADLLTGTQWSAGGGINFGALSLSIVNPVSLAIAPTGFVTLRF